MSDIDPGTITGNYHAGLPNGRARQFKPLPRRTSPKPWDSDGLQRHFETMPKAGEVGRYRKGGVMSYRWGPELERLAVGDRFEIEGVTRVAVGKAINWHGNRLERKFDAVETGLRRYVITRVE